MFSEEERWSQCHWSDQSHIYTHAFLGLYSEKFGDCVLYTEPVVSNEEETWWWDEAHSWWAISFQTDSVLRPGGTDCLVLLWLRALYLRSLWQKWIRRGRGGPGKRKGGGGGRNRWQLAANVIATPLALVPPSWHLFSIYTISFLFL